MEVETVLLGQAVIGSRIADTFMLVSRAGAILDLAGQVDRTADSAIDLISGQGADLVTILKNAGINVADLALQQGTTEADLMAKLGQGLGNLSTGGQNAITGINDTVNGGSVDPTTGIEKVGQTVEVGTEIYEFGKKNKWW